MSARASFSPDEVAAMHGISGATVRRAVNAGRVARVPNCGRAIRIAFAEVEAQFGPIPERVLAQYDTTPGQVAS